MKEGSPSFKSFRRLFFESLSERGFSKVGDIALKDLSAEFRAQIIVGGNDYYLAISIHLSMPSAARTLSNAMGRKTRFNSGRVFNPVLSASIPEIIADDDPLRALLEKADWPSLCAEVTAVAELIVSFYEEGRSDSQRLSRDFWWPETLSAEQAAMLTIGAKRSRNSQIMNSVDRYLGRQAVFQLEQYKRLLNEVMDFDPTLRLI